MKPVYLDNNATTRVDPPVVEAMLPFFTEQFGNASSIHAFGASVGGALKTARKQLQELLGADHDHEIVYTSGGTESDNTAILVGAGSAGRPRRNRDEQGRASGGSLRSASISKKPAAPRSTISAWIPSAGSTSKPIAPRLSRESRSSR